MTNEDNSFIKTIKYFYRKITIDSMVPMNNTLERDEFLLILRKSLITQNYQPDPPREYIVFNKHNCVARIVPTFTLKDYCIYFYCIKKLEDCLCEDRVDGTFGGWRLPPKKIKTYEELEKEGLQYEIYYSPSTNFTSLSVKEWIKNWKEFSHLTYSKYKTFFCDDNNKVVLIFDIANFYDNIKIDILEKKLRLKCQDSKINYFIDLLIYFLRYWNKPFEGYSPKSVGIPQEETGDCSRLLANFYLQKYDKIISNKCKAVNAEYLRYSDDMMIFAPSKDVAEKLLFEASKELHKLGLNINTGKVKFLSKFEFGQHEAFEILENLESINAVDINRAIELFLYNLQHKISFHKERVIKRLITVLSKKDLKKIDQNMLNNLLNYMLEDEVLSDATVWYLDAIYEICKKMDKLKIFFDKLNRLVFIVNFNSFHYNLKKFYKKRNIEFNEKIIDDEISKRKIYA